MTQDDKISFEELEAGFQRLQLKAPQLFGYVTPAYSRARRERGLRSDCFFVLIANMYFVS